MAFRLGEDGKVHFQARVDPAASYALGVRQPPFSAVFAVDTSSSMDPYEHFLTQGLRSFLADVQPGREVVSVVPFDEPPLLPDWEDDPYVLQGAFDAHVVPPPGSSSVETGLVDAADLLAEREGARAILLVTDAETPSYEVTPELWDRLAAVRPIIFAVHIGGVEQPVLSRQRMQAWAASGGGVYVYPATAGEMDRAFERMATWLRRPAAYALSYSTSPVDLDPGLIAIDAPADGSRPTTAPGVGVELILDTSGVVDPPVTFREVVVAGGQRVDLELPASNAD